jgi:hypothetical protein
VQRAVESWKRFCFQMGLGFQVLRFFSDRCILHRCFGFYKSFVSIKRCSFSFRQYASKRINIVHLGGCFQALRNNSLFSCRLKWYAARKSHHGKLQVFACFFHYTWSSLRAKSILSCMMRHMNRAKLSNAFLKWRQGINSQMFEKNHLSVQCLLRETQQNNHDLMAQVSTMERYKHLSLAKMNEIRTNLVIVDDISCEISGICRNICSARNEFQ